MLANVKTGNGKADVVAIPESPQRAKRKVIRPTEKRMDFESYYRLIVGSEIVGSSEKSRKGLNLPSWSMSALRNLCDVLR